MKILTDEGVNYLVEKIKANIVDFVSSSTITRIEVVDALPETEETGVLYLVKEATTEEPVVEYVTSPTMEMGYFSTSSGSLSDSTEYCRTADYVYIKGKPTLTFTNGIGANMSVICYDENKNFMTNWFVDTDGSTYSYKRIADTGTFTFPDNVYYIKLRFSSTEIVNVTIVYE